MKITVKKMEMVEHEIEVDFPFYGHEWDSLDSAPVSWDKWVRVDEGGLCTVVTITDDRDDKSYEIKIKKRTPNNALAAYGNLDNSSEDEFKAALKQVEEALRRYG